MMHRTLIGLAISIAALAAPEARAQAEFPSRQLQVIMPGTPGGSFDIMTRMVMAKLGERLPQPVVIENVPGAAGMIAAERGAKAEADGHRLVIGYFGNLAANPWLFPKLSYDPVKDFRPVVLLGSLSYIAAVPAASPFKTLEDLVKAARANPGKINFASGGNATGGHIGGELLKSVARLDMVHVPYQSAAPASLALLGGQVDWAFEAMPTAIGNVKAGKLRALAVSSPQRFPLLADVPTVAEQGYPGFEVGGWVGVLLPARAPDAAVRWLNAEINRVLQSPEIRNGFAERGADAMGGTPEQFADYLKSEIEKYGRIIKGSGAKAG